MKVIFQEQITVYIPSVKDILFGAKTENQLDSSDRISLLGFLLAYAEEIDFAQEALADNSSYQAPTWEAVRQICRLIDESDTYNQKHQILRKFIELIYAEEVLAEFEKIQQGQSKW